MAFSVIAVSISVLRGRGLRHRHVEHVGAEALAGQLERHLGARRRLEEQVDLREAAQDRGLFLGPAVHVDIGFGQVQEGGDLPGSHAFDAKEMLEGRTLRRGH
jgi:hypothetical protein